MEVYFLIAASTAASALGFALGADAKVKKLEVRIAKLEEQLKTKGTLDK